MDVTFRLAEDVSCVTCGIRGEEFKIKLPTDTLIPGCRIRFIDDFEHQLSIQSMPNTSCKDGACVSEYVVKYITIDQNKFFPSEWLKAGTQFKESGRAFYSERAMDWGTGDLSLQDIKNKAL